MRRKLLLSYCSECKFWNDKVPTCSLQNDRPYPVSESACDKGKSSGISIETVERKKLKGK